MDDDPEEGEEDAHAPHHQTVQLQTPTAGGEGGQADLRINRLLGRSIVMQYQATWLVLHILRCMDIGSKAI